MNWIFKIFIKDYENVKDAKVRTSYGKFAGIFGIVTNILLSAFKLTAGVVVGSIALIADGINNLTDASSSVITLVGFKLAGMPEDEEHPYGHARIEYVTGLLIAFIIVVAGLQLLKVSIAEAINPAPTEYSGALLLALAAAALAKGLQGLVYHACGKRIGSVTLSAAAADSRNDILATCAVIAGLTTEKLTGLPTDGYIGSLVALFIIYSGIMLVKETSAPLLGESPDPDLVNAIYEEIDKHEVAIGHHDLIIHSYGAGKTFASIHVEVDSENDIMESHDMIDNIERAVKKDLNVDLTIHMDPIKVGDPLTLELLELAENAISDFEGVYSVHDLRIVKGHSHINVLFDVILSPSCKHTKSEIYNAVNSAFSLVGENFHVSITFDTALTRS